eukprot:SAG11_NODE_1358_length_5120_cov_1.838080_6_plen_242_part_00
MRELEAALLCNRSATRLRLKDSAGALRDAGRALEARPRLPKGHMRLAQALGKLERYPAAIAQAELAAELALAQTQEVLGDASAGAADADGRNDSSGADVRGTVGAAAKLGKAASALAERLRKKMIAERAADAIALLEEPPSPPPPPLLLQVVGSEQRKGNGGGFFSSLLGGGYTVYNLRVALPDGLVLTSQKRYSEFEALHATLLPALLTHDGWEVLPPQAAVCGRGGSGAHAREPAASLP